MVQQFRTNTNRRGSKQPDKCQPDGSKYYLKYKKKAGNRGRVKAAGWVDMDLPTTEQPVQLGSPSLLKLFRKKRTET